MQELTLKILKSGHNVFLTGSAGTGKTHVIKEYIFYLKARKIIPTILAPTGIAASHLNGQTIHSFFSLGINENIDNEFIFKLLSKKHVKTRLNNLKVLIIDEISMVSPNLFGCLDNILRTFKQNDKPFGGIQVVLSGDFFQLPPIVNSADGKRFAWQNPSWRALDLQTCYLQKKYRQNDNQLISILDDIRDGNVSKSSYDILKSCVNKKLDLDFNPTKLYTHNVDVDEINDIELKKIPHVCKVFKFRSEGDKSKVEKLLKSALVQEELTLKKDAVVMFIKNRPDKGYINGTIGMVTGFTDEVFNLPIVKLSNGHLVNVEYDDWVIENEKGKVQAKISQIPLKLAWAITIHKSQGMTLDAAEIDLSKTFEVGQGYVALSRVKNINGLRLIGFNQVALCVDPLILSVDSRIKQASKKSIDKISDYTHNQLETLERSYIMKLGGLTECSEIEKEINELRKEPRVEIKISNHLKTKNQIEISENLTELASNAGFSVSTVINHLALIKKEEPEFDISKYMPNMSVIHLVNNAIKDIKSRSDPDHFSDDGGIRLKSIFVKLEEKVSYQDIKMILIS